MATNNNKNQQQQQHALITHTQDLILFIYSDRDSNQQPILTDIVSLSFGAERTFRLRRVSDNQVVFCERLKSGSLLRMKNQCQALYKHEVPAEKTIETPRINLTFRLNHYGR